MWVIDYVWKYKTELNQYPEVHRKKTYFRNIYFVYFCIILLRVIIDLKHTQLLRFYFSRMNHFIFTNSYHHIHLRPLWSYNTTITTQTTILYLVRGNKSRKIANKALFSNICNNGCCFHWNAFRSAWCNESLSVRRWPLEDGSRAGCRYRLSVVNFGL